MDSLRQGIEAAKAGQRDVARRHLAEAIRADPNNETAWLWMSGVVSSPQERIQCLQRVLAINPSNEVALRGLRALGVEPDVATPEPPPTPSPAEVTDIPPPAEVTASYEPIEAEEELPAYAYDSPIPVPDADALEAARHAVSGVLRDLDDEAALGELGIMWQRQASSQVRQSVTPSVRLPQIRLKVNPIYIAAGVGAVVLVVAVIVLINAIGAAQERAEIAAQPTPIPPTITDTPTPTVTPRPTRTPIPESLSLTPEPTVTLGAAPRGDLAFGITPTSPYVATPHGSSPLTGAINAFYRADYEMALERIAEAREAGETPEDLYYIEGRTLLALGETEEAVEVLQEGLDLYPGFAPLHAALGLAYAQQGRFEQARAANEEAQQRDPLLLEAYIQQAELFLRQGDPDSAAIELFEARGLDRYTYDVRLITTEARLNLVREDIERAVALSRLGYYIDPSSEEVNITLAESRLELGLVQTALVGLEDYLYNVYPSSALGWTLLAEAYQQVGRFDDALFAYQRAFQLDEDLFRARIGRGTYYADRAEYDLALVDFNGAVRAEPDNPQARLGRARTLSELGRYEDAVSDYATYFELLGIDPVEATSEQLDVLVDYITTLAESGQTETVLELADNTLSTELSAAQSAALAEARAVALLEEGEPEDALQAIEDALALEETGARHYRRGLILEELEEYEAAIRDFEWVLFWDNVYGFPFAADAALRIDDLQDLLAELEDEAP